MTAATPPTRLRGRLAFWILACVALLASHDAVFLVQLGPGEGLVRALRSAGHGYWGAASIVLAAVGIAGIGASIARLTVLRRRARRLRVDGVAAGTPRPLARLGATWGRLFAVVAIGFVLQESGEHVATHSHAIGLGALLGPEYPLAIPVIAIVTFVAACAATLLAGAEESLMARIAGALSATVRRAPRTVGHAPLEVARPRRSPLARSAAGRAPPLASASPI